MDLFPSIYAAGALVCCLRADDSLSPWADGWGASLRGLLPATSELRAAQVPADSQRK